jgi:hypothetical protein
MCLERDIAPRPGGRRGTDDGPVHHRPAARGAGLIERTSARSHLPRFQRLQIELRRAATHRPLSRARLRVPPAGGRAAGFRQPRICVWSGGVSPPCWQTGRSRRGIPPSCSCGRCLRGRGGFQTRQRVPNIRIDPSHPAASGWRCCRCRRSGTLKRGWSGSVYSWHRAGKPDLRSRVSSRWQKQTSYVLNLSLSGHDPQRTSQAGLREKVP